MSRIAAAYWIETPLPPEQAAAAMAGEQSSGTFVSVPGETPELMERHAARVESIDLLDNTSVPSLPGGKIGPVYRRAHVRLSWPLENTGHSLPNVLSTVAGNLFELAQFSGLRLLDVQFPASFATVHPGPQFGVAGTRRLSGVSTLPLIGTIVKPSVGLSPETTAELVARLADGGIDFIKDDELQADGPHCPFDDRVAAVMRAIDRHADATGKKVMYAFNLTGEIDEMLRRHDTVLRAGGSCVMASLNSCGLPGVARLRREAALPIHGHRNGWGIFSRCPALGMSYVAYQKFWRLAGVDHMHVNGLRNKFSEADDSVIASARECSIPMFAAPAPGYEVMPVFSSGQWAGQAVDTYRALGSADLIYACGGGIMAHPGGPAAGVRSVRQAWEAAMAGETLEHSAATHTELRQALETFAR
ncbi:MAG: ribulose-bisphosphate carboxylase large subunit family protein [Bryobacteraceae bacterium]